MAPRSPRVYIYEPNFDSPALAAHLAGVPGGTAAAPVSTRAGAGRRVSGVTIDQSNERKQAEEKRRTAGPREKSDSSREKMGIGGIRKSIVALDARRKKRSRA